MDLTPIKERYFDRFDWDARIQRARLAFFRIRHNWIKRRLTQRVLAVSAWGIAISFYGLALGAAIVLAPPMVGIAMTILPFPFILWALPDTPSAPIKTLHRAFFAALVVNLCLPTYYMVRLPGIPWLELRRIFLLPVVLLTAYIFAISKEERQGISTILSTQRALSICVIGFFVMGSISVLVSSNPGFSFSKLSDVGLTWYLPFFAAMIVVRAGVRVEDFYKFVAAASIPVILLGIADFLAQRNFAINVIPSGMLAKMAADSPVIAGILAANPFRNGWYRASSIYNSPLSFGEFAAMVAPVGAHYIVHGRGVLIRFFGFGFLICALAGIFASGSRGGYVGFLVGMSLLGILYVARYLRTHPRSMLAPLVTISFLLGFSAVGGLFMSSHRLNMIVFGVGVATASDNGRSEQWHMAIPHIIANPVTGYGLGRGAEVVGWAAPGGDVSIDSFALSMIVETGVPGFIFYFGIIAIGMMVAAKTYLRDADPQAEIGAGLAASLSAYGIYRFFLSQHENQMLFFLFLALTYLIGYPAFSRRSTNNAGSKLTEKTNKNLAY